MRPCVSSSEKDSKMPWERLESTFRGAQSQRVFSESDLFWALGKPWNPSEAFPQKNGAWDRLGIRANWGEDGRLQRILQKIMNSHWDPTICGSLEEH